MQPARPGQAIWAGQISGAAKPGVQTYCWTPGILLSAIRAILYVVGSGLKGSRLRTTYLIMRSSTCNKIECQTHPRRILLNRLMSSGLMPQEMTESGHAAAGHARSQYLEKMLQIIQNRRSGSKVHLPHKSLHQSSMRLNVALVA